MLWNIIIVCFTYVFRKKYGSIETANIYLGSWKINLERHLCKQTSDLWTCNLLDIVSWWAFMLVVIYHDIKNHRHTLQCILRYSKEKIIRCWCQMVLGKKFNLGLCLTFYNSYHVYIYIAQKSKLTPRKLQKLHHTYP